METTSRNAAILRKLRSDAMRLLRSAIIIYLGVLLLLMLLENRLVFPASRAVDSWREPPPGVVDVNLTSPDGTPLHAWYLPCEGSKGAVLYLHGNGGNLSHRGTMLTKLRETTGCGVLARISHSVDETRPPFPA